MRNFNSGWQQQKAEIFWGEIAPQDHVIQFYEDETFLLQALSGYVGSGINAGDCCIVIATNQHLEALERTLETHGLVVAALKRDQRYIPLNAEEVLNRFMVNGLPDESLFMEYSRELLRKLRPANGGIRAFGEMVALLWEKGEKQATIELEKLWNKLRDTESFCLFCAYPESSFKYQDESIHTICELHSKVITGSRNQLKDVYYKNKSVEQQVLD
jgi:hypothetical protein